MNLNDYLVGNKEATFMLQVKSNSMNDAGLMEGDMVLVEKVEEAEPGRIVIAEIQGAWNIRYLRKGAKGLYLEAADPDCKLVFLGVDLRIAAIVTAMIRKY